jgi:hypothetical protein
MFFSDTARSTFGASQPALGGWLGRLSTEWSRARELLHCAVALLAQHDGVADRLDERVNIPIVVVAIVGGRLLIPESRDLHAPKVDPVSAGLSIAASSAVLYGIIEGPQAGWTSTTVVTAFAVGVTALGAFVGWELHTDEPMLPMNFFRRRRFTAATVAITSVFFALFSAQFD